VYILLWHRVCAVGGGQKQRLTATEEDGVSWFSDAVAVVKVDDFDIILFFLVPEPQRHYHRGVPCGT